MHTVRHAVPEDAALITGQRHSMFAANGYGSAEDLEAMDRTFEPWVRERLGNGSYVGFLVEEDGEVLAGAGIYFLDFPPHFLHSEPGRPYLLNFYTADAARGRGFAKLLLQQCVDECRARGYKNVVLHASRFGRPIYERFGFEATSEMMFHL